MFRDGATFVRISVDGTKAPISVFLVSQEQPLPAELPCARCGSAALFARHLIFADDVRGFFIGPQAEIDRLAQFALAGPLRELHSATNEGRTQVVTCSSFTLAGTALT